MSRSGYSDDLDILELGRWRGMVASAIRGKRGQKLLTDMLAALDAMPDKRLIPHELQDRAGDVCALGALGRVRGVDLSKLDAEDPDSVAVAFDIATPLAQEIVFMNDEWFDDNTPEERWASVRRWVASQIKPLPEGARA
jgi:hypothetical protein